MNKFPLNKDKSPAVADWKKYTGAVTTPLQGIVVPNGYIVIDLDLYKNKSLLQDLASLKLDFNNAYIQSTINGGKHYVFRCDEILRQGSNIEGIIGFDTRVANKGYIATGKGYNAIKEDFFTPEQPLLSKEAIQLLKTKETVSNDSISNSDIPCTNSKGLPYSKKEIRGILFSLPKEIGADDSSWFKVCCGLKRQVIASNMSLSTIYRKSHWAYQLLDEWSKTRDGYNETVEQNNWKRWNSITNNTNNAITLASVLALTPKEEVRELKNLTDGDIKKLKGIEQWFKLNGKYYNIVDNCQLVKDDFNSECAKYVPEDVKTTASNYFLKSFKVIYRDVYEPLNKYKLFYNGNVLTVNKFRRQYHSNEYKHDIYQYFISHIKLLYPQDYKLILYYFASIVKNQGKLMRWALLLQSCQRTGKTLLVSILRKVLGSENTKEVSPRRDICSNFNNWAYGGLLGIVEELDLKGQEKYNIYNDIKPMITNDTISVVAKGKDPKTAINSMNYIFLTNYKNPIKIEEGDERFCVLFSKWQDTDKFQKYLKENDPHRIDKMIDILNNEISSIYNGLKNEVIPNHFKDFKNAPSTKAKEVMISLGKSDCEINFLDILEKNLDKITVSGGDINITYLNKIMNEQRIITDKEYPSHRNLKPILNKLHYYKVKDRKIDGIVSTIYSKNVEV